MALKLPIRIVGNNPAAICALTAILAELRGQGATSLRADHGASIAVDPDPRDRLVYGDQHVLMFTEAQSALSYLRKHGWANFARCNAIFLPTRSCIDAFVAAGFPERKIFLLEADGSGTWTEAVLRWLLFCGLVPVQSFDTDLFAALRTISVDDQLCIGLPESTRRSSAFTAAGPRGFRNFDGIKRPIGWQGCGWSYVAIARAALKNCAYPITICEDDMRPNAQFDARLQQVRDYLDQTEWDLFSGLLTNVAEDCKISRVERRGDLTFVHLDFMTGMVLNIYGRKSLERLEKWNPSRGGPEVNTIDAWLGSARDLRVVTALPFLASHDSDQTSTIFGFRNKRYDSVIAASERRLRRMVAEFEDETAKPPEAQRRGAAIKPA